MQTTIQTTTTLFALAIGSGLTAQLPVFTSSGQPVPPRAGQLIAAADFEGDGDPDLFTTTGVFLNRRGFFEAGPTLPSSFVPTTNVYCAGVADLTGDGRMDLLIGRAGGSPSGLAILAAPPVGGTTFLSLPAAFPGATTMYEFAIADFDGDGDADVVAATTSTVTPVMQLFLGNGAGAFTAANTTQWPTAPVAATWIGAGDFDGDGLVDVFASGTNGPLWRRNLGGGAFGPSIALGSSLVADQGAIGDFDGNGCDDVFFSTVQGTELVCSGAPTGLGVGVAAFGGILGPPPFAADLDGDGFDDLLRSVVGVSGAASGRLVVRAGSPLGLGLAVPLDEVPFGFGNPMPYPGLAQLDADGDGDLDLAIVPGVGTPGIVQNQNGVLSPLPQALPRFAEAAYAPPGDVDGDGDLDLVHARLDGGVVHLETSRNDGRGIFGPRQPAGAYSGFRARSVWHDLDADGDQDLLSVFATVSSSVVQAVLNDGFGVFSDGPSIAVPGRVLSVACGDLDGDGVPDLVLGRSTTIAFPPQVQPPMIAAGTNAGGILGYGVPFAFGTADVVGEIELVDVDADGDRDALCAVSTASAPAAPKLYANVGAFAFVAAPPFQLGAVARTVTAGDLTGDGLPDLVLGGQVWVQTTGGFVLQSSHATPLGSISLADLDEDGRLDLVDSAGRWYPGLPGAAFAAPADVLPFAPAAPLLPWPGKIRPVDLDGDLDLDFVDPGEGEVAVYANPRRQLDLRTVPIANASLELTIRGPASAPFLLGVSFGGSSPAPIALPPYGTLFLDPPTLQVFAVGALSPAGRFDFATGPLPAGLGVVAAWQALVPTGLTNGVDTHLP